MPAPKPAAAPAEWLPKEQAAKLLGVKVRALERREAQGYIEKQIQPRKPTERAARVLYSRADIVALKAGTPNVHAREVDPDAPVSIDTAQPASNRLKPSQDGSTALAVRNGGGTAALQRAGFIAYDGFIEQLARAVDVLARPKPETRPWLTLDEAVAYSGLTRKWLLQNAEMDSNLVLDMGSHARGGRWRFNREGLGKGSA